MQRKSIMIDFKMAYTHSKDLNVLYIEDIEDVRKSTAEVLEEYFSTLDVAEDGLDGVKKYREYYDKYHSYYDLVISDIEMPYLNGIELSDKVLEINSDQVIIIFSIHSDPMYLFELMNLGISSFLSKPIKTQQLNKVLFRVCQMITARKSELELHAYEKEEKKFLLEVMDLQDNIIVITDGEHIESANQSLLDFFDFKTVEDFKKAYECICFTFMNSEGYFHLGLLTENKLWIEHIVNNQDQDFMVLMQNTKTQKAESFKVSINYFHSKKRYIATFSNITNIALKNKTDRYKATHDDLTGIYNRHKLNDLLSSHFSPIVEDEVQSFAFILFDIDHFKEINDTHGHLAGDQVLRQLTSTIKENIRGSDIFVRWGGDEFILVIEDVTAEQVMKVAEHLCHTIEQEIFVKVGQLTCSFGVSLYRNGDTLSQMMSRVDKAMYDAKNCGRNQIRYV